MKSITSDALFKIGDYEITLPMILLAGLCLILFIAIIAYRFNHRTQQKATKYMDDESLIYNKKGLEKYFKKKRRRFSNPTLVVVEIRNLNYLYSNNQKRNKLLLNITDKFLGGLKSIEVVGRVEFNKFLIAYNKLDREQVKEKCIAIEKKFDDFVFEEYGQFDFNVYFGIYPNAPLKNKDVIDIACAIIKYSNITDGKRYYYCDEVAEAVARIKRMNLEKDFDFEQKRFVPYIQPKVDFKTGQVVGGEILVRWVDDNNNFKYSPAEFIPLFESNGFIKKVDDLMFKHACNLAKTIAAKNHPNVVISVNVSKLNFLAPDFEKRIKANLAECNVNPRHVEIEVTETTVSENFQYVSNCIMSLRQMGFNVAMDDFGQEYSSLGLLSSNPFDTIKLDRIFFRNKLQTDKDKHIVRNLLDMLSKLNYKKVCEGVSDKQTLDVLATINQDIIIQGFCISPPIPVSQFEAFLDTVFEFNYPPIEEYSNVNLPNIDGAKVGIEKEANGQGGSNTSINITGLGGQTQQHDYSKDFEDLRNKMSNMENRLAERNRQNQEDELRLLKEELLRMQANPRTNSNEIESLRREIDMLRTQRTSPAYIHSDIYSRDDEIHRLRREIEDIRYQQDRDRDRSRFDREYFEREQYGRYESSPFIKKEANYVDNSSEIEKLQQQIRELQEQQRNQPQLDVNLLIERLSKNNNSTHLYDLERQRSETQSLREKLEQERKERAELEALLAEFQNKEESLSYEEEEELQRNADSNLNLSLDSLSDFEDEDIDEDEDDEEVETEKVEKPTLTLEELEAIIKSYQDKYQDNWAQAAQSELKEGFSEVVNGLKYYKENKKMTFLDKVKNMSPELKQIYNIIKNEFMKYNGITNKITNTYDCFYIGRNQVAKMSITSRKVKVYLAADPSKYSFPHKDFSHKKVHARTPYYTLLKSPLSIKRASKVFEDIATEHNLSVNQNHKPVDYVMKFKFMKTE